MKSGIIQSKKIDRIAKVWFPFFKTILYKVINVEIKNITAVILECSPSKI